MTAISVATTTKLLLKSCSTGFSSGKCKRDQQTELCCCDEVQFTRIEKRDTRVVVGKHRNCSRDQKACWARFKNWRASLKVASAGLLYCSANLNPCWAGFATASKRPAQNLTSRNLSLSSRILILLKQLFDLLYSSHGSLFKSWFLLISFCVLLSKFKFLFSRILTLFQLLRWPVLYSTWVLHS